MKKYDAANDTLSDPEQIKLLLLYIFIAVRRPMTETELTDAVRYDELCNYFDMAGCLKELVRGGLVDRTEIDGDYYYSPTAKGFSTLSELEHYIPKSVRDKANLASTKTLASIIRKEAVGTEIKEVPMGYMVTLTLNDESMRIFETTLYMPSIGQANALCKSFKEDPEKVYFAFMNAVTEKTSEEEA